MVLYLVYRPGERTIYYMIYTYMYRIYPFQAGCRTRYFPQENLREAEGVPRAAPSALPRLPKNYYCTVLSTDTGLSPIAFAEAFR